MKKILVATLFASFLISAGVLSVMARTAATESDLSVPIQVKRATLDLACMKSAVEKRENVIQTAWDKFSGAIKSALETRKSELLAAWDIQDNAQRRAAIKAAWAKFKTSRISATQTLRQERLEAWKQFRIDRAACGSGPTGEDPAVDMTL